MSAVSDFETALDAAITAVEASDFTTARLKLFVAKMHYAKIPVETRLGGTAVRYNEVTSLQTELDKLESRTSTLTSGSVRHLSLEGGRG